MRYTYFDITDFKGIEHVRLDLSRSPFSKVHTLVGLNESGKTTILEAINLLSYREKLDALDFPGYGVHSEIHDLIPIAKRANFNGQITIKAGAELSDSDIRSLRASLIEAYSIKDLSVEPAFEIIQSYKFKASIVTPGPSTNNWTLKIRGRLPKTRRAQPLTGDTWNLAVSTIRGMLPKIAYFPNFLFDFPDRIYLSPINEDEGRHVFYRKVLQDVLDALGENLTIAEHILARAESPEPSAKKPLESVILRMNRHITETVFSQWDRILKRKAGSKEIIVNLDKDEVGKWFVRLRLKENGELYEISERSLGFRWFFTYLLLTQYRGFRQSESNSVVFLLDEPASNLHPSAQAQLLDSFAALPEGCGVVYTTHSHHLINPEWLEDTFVVKNEGLEYGKDDTEFTSQRTLITLLRYRTFAAKHPDQTTYFQPVLDVLDYVPSRLEAVPDAVMLEGKSDFYILHLMQHILKRDEVLHMLPGGGAGGLDQPIQLYLGWGRNFIVLLDSDKEGRRQRKRYIDRFGLMVEQRVVLFEDIDAELAGSNIEQLFQHEDHLTIQKVFDPTATTFDKSSFHRAVQELVVTQKTVEVSDKARTNFGVLLDFLEKRLEQLREV